MLHLSHHALGEMAGIVCLFFAVKNAQRLFM